jgi:bifunctional DNA-binding transcriptional regulator/antitoxin component of YhaV-PrlF toxin-antitoxin module
MSESRVGSKGELFPPPKDIREKLELKPHTKIIYKVIEGSLIVEPVPSLKEVLQEEPVIEITLEEFHKDRKKLSLKAEQ